MQVSVSPASVSSDPQDLARSVAGFMRYAMLAGDKEFLKQVDELDLSLTQLKILSHLYELPVPAEGEELQLLSLKEVAEQLGISLPATSRSIDPLVKRRLVVRREDALDRRVKRVRLTARGEAAVAGLFATRVASIEALLAQFTDSERAKLADAFNEILGRPEINRYCHGKDRS
jgi:DNA-binding MarR family transcriptional regulator